MGIPKSHYPNSGMASHQKMRFRINTTPRLTNIRMRRSITICFASCSVSELVIATAYINTTTKGDEVQRGNQITNLLAIVVCYRARYPFTC